MLSSNDANGHYLHCTPLSDAEAVQRFRDDPTLLTTGWEACMVRHIAALEREVAFLQERLDESIRENLMREFGE